MRLLPWRAAQPQDASDQAKLDERLARLTKPPVQDAVPATSAATAQPVAAAAPISPTPSSDAQPDRRRRRRFGFLLFFAGLIPVLFLVRAIPSDWEIGPFRIDVSGSAADTASLYFADDPHAPFWLLVPTFNLPPRFFAARPNSTARPIVALASTPSATPSPSGSASTSPSASPSSSASPSASPSGSASPSA